MRQVSIDIGSGKVRVRDLPAPIVQAGQVLVASAASLVSAGTERHVVELARKSMVGKARARPDDVRRVLQKVKQEGLVCTLAQVRAKLQEPMSLGYSAAGIVLQCGDGVPEFKPGDRVAAVGPHASIFAAGRNLCVRIADGVSFEQAACTSIAAVALEGVRLARVDLGSRVVVVGLGLVGLFAVGLLKAQGCRVLGCDIDRDKLEMAQTFGADEAVIGLPVEQAYRFSDHYGVDAVIISTATASNEPIEFAAAACRSRGRIVVVGVAGLSVPRRQFFEKELELTVSYSMGPGRGDALYEERGIDLPIGQTRWTMQRNMQAVLETIGAGRLPVEKLITHRFPIASAMEAYEKIDKGGERMIGVLLEYPKPELVKPARKVVLEVRPARSGALGLSLIGGGNYVRLVMMPTLARLGNVSLRGICTARGMNAVDLGRKGAFAYATTDAAEVFSDPDTDAVFIATRHDLHAELLIAALENGKHVFVEKPLCVNADDLAAVSRCLDALGSNCPLLMVGFNRRFAPATAVLRSFFKGLGPLSIIYRFTARSAPAESWVNDYEVGGGRIIGEACHAIDLCVALADSAPIRVYAESLGNLNKKHALDDCVLITIKHANGSVSVVAYQTGSDPTAPAERIEVAGGDRSAVIDNWARVYMWKNGRCRSVNGHKNKGQAAGFAAFVEACRRGVDWPIAWDQLYGVTWASLAAVESLQGCTPISLAYLALGPN
jgi:predicted dehydrogenase